MPRMFSQLAGIQTDGVGYKRIIIRPTPPSPSVGADQKPIDWVLAYYDSIRGRIASAWKLDSGRLSLDLTIPANTTATVYLPARDAASITESGKALAQAQGVKFLRTEGNRVVLAVESGSYHFSTGTPQ